ncbi:MAG: NfeD family protein [Candidatus Rokubacteria bacterium]|nr:NfeD family protein [Candidatus Rokubacteria bacterium]
MLSAAGRQGTIRLDGELWTACGREMLTPGGRVRIVELDGLTAVVQRGVPRAGRQILTLTTPSARACAARDRPGAHGRPRARRRATRTPSTRASSCSPRSRPS